MNDAVKLELGGDGILVATMDLPGRPMNVLAGALVEGLATLPARLADPAVRGLVLTGGKADFCAGADLDGLVQWTRPEQPFEELDGAEEACCARHRDAGQAGGRRDQRACAGRWFRGRAGLPRADRRRRPAPQARPARGQAGPAARGWRHAAAAAAGGPAAGDADLRRGRRHRRRQGTGHGPAGRHRHATATSCWPRRAPGSRQPQARAALGRPKFRIPGGDSRSPAWCRCWPSRRRWPTARTWGNYPAVHAHHELPVRRRPARLRQRAAWSRAATSPPA
jgi:3-hydroxyacyl-CoA dehydrogenase/enoyl-CoA hydratase/3-hydroxybutyryl-CoA epimerase